jgi:integral membrane protein
VAEGSVASQSSNAMIRDSVCNEQLDARAIQRGLLIRYRVMAFTTATLLIVLVFVGIPLQLMAGRPQVANVVGTLHGYLYIVYLYVAFRLTRRLGVPKWQMALVLVAGTVPFCAFVAERKMTRRFEAATQEPRPSATRRRRSSLKTRAPSLRTRWFSRRALLLHLEVAIIAPGCAVAGWWQATRALAGNGLSWAYSVEWPVFALLAIAAWWHLIHEDPEAYRARRARPLVGEKGTGVDATARPSAPLGREEPVTVEPATARWATALAVAVGVEFVLGTMALLFVPFTRPSGSLPSRGEAIYLVHAGLGLLVALGAVALLLRVRGFGRISRLVGWMGFIGVALAGVGGLLTEAQSLVRFFGMSLMLVGSVSAGLSYLIPTFFRLQRRAPSVLAALPPSGDPTALS